MAIGPADSALLISELTARPRAAKQMIPRARPPARKASPVRRGAVPNASQPARAVQAVMAMVVATVLAMWPTR